MGDYLIEVAALLLRWLHVVAAIAWIGESFYFVMLDRALKPVANGPKGMYGELWSVHGGGFYHKQKYLPAPAELPADLHWSKWKSYTTWLSGFALFALSYLMSPKVHLIDPQVAQLSEWQAIALALALPVLAWIVYDLACRLVGFRDRVLGLVVAVLVIALAWTATQLFAGRAAFLIVGAALATIMSANVFFVIIPGQKRMVAALQRGESPDPLPGMRGKQRSVHNTYFTLPVVFAMLSNHYATGYAHEHAWIVLLLFMGAGALIRQFFVLWHGGARAWWLLAAGGVLLACVFAWLAPSAAIGGTQGAAAQAITTRDLMPLVHRHCSSCHSATPTLMPSAPKGAIFDSEESLELRADLVHQQVNVLRIMPPGNLTQMSEQERAMFVAWYVQRTPDQGR